jgi:hypothetical protein
LYCISFYFVVGRPYLLYTYYTAYTNVFDLLLYNVLLFTLNSKTIVIPLKYPPSPSPLLIPPPPPQQLNNKDTVIPSSSLELEGNGPADNNNGTTFWLEGTSPEEALEKIHHVSDGSNDDDGGIGITPSLGSGILFNGYETRCITSSLLFLCLTLLSIFYYYYISCYVIDEATDTNFSFFDSIRNHRATTTITVPLRRPRPRPRRTNSEITHTGSAIAEGTRYVLMTSITLDEEEDCDDYDDDDDDDDDDNDDINEDDE